MHTSGETTALRALKAVISISEINRLRSVDLETHTVTGRSSTKLFFNKVTEKASEKENWNELNAFIII